DRYARHASVVIVKPGGTGSPRLVISARFAPLPPRRSLRSLFPSVKSYTNLGTTAPSATSTDHDFRLLHDCTDKKPHETAPTLTNHIIPDQTINNGLIQFPQTDSLPYPNNSLHQWFTPLVQTIGSHQFHRCSPSFTPAPETGDRSPLLGSIRTAGPPSRGQPLSPGCPPAPDGPAFHGQSGAGVEPPC